MLNIELKAMKRQYFDIKKILNFDLIIYLSSTSIFVLSVNYIMVMLNLINIYNVFRCHQEVQQLCWPTNLPEWKEGQCCPGNTLAILLYVNFLGKKTHTFFI